MYQTFENTAFKPESPSVLFDDQQINTVSDPHTLLDIIESLYDFVAIFNKHFILLECSKSFNDLFKSHIGAPVQKHMDEIIPDFKNKDLYSEYAMAVNRMGYFERDYFSLTDSTLYNGTTYIQFKMTPQDALIICIASDITVQVQYDILSQQYLKLLSENDQLETSLSSFNSFSATNQQLTGERRHTNFQYKLEHQYNLTPKEIETATLIIKRISTPEISEILSISIKTVYFHRNNIRKKLNAIDSKKSLRSLLLAL